MAFTNLIVKNKKIFMTGSQVLTAVFSLLLTMGCASIPKESPELSHEVGQRMVAMKEAHLNLVNKYFDLKRADVHRIFNEEWIPAYAENFFSQQQVADYWNKLVTEDSKEDRLQFLVQLGPRMLDDIRSKRAEFIEPLNKLQAQVEDSLQNEYNRVLSANNTLTSFLTSSSKVTQTRDRYLELFDVEQKEVNSYINKIDEESEKIIGSIKKANI